MKHILTKTKFKKKRVLFRGWIAKNHGEHDISNVSLGKTKAELERRYKGYNQEILPITITIREP